MQERILRNSVSLACEMKTGAFDVEYPGISRVFNVYPKVLISVVLVLTDMLIDRTDRVLHRLY